MKYRIKNDSDKYLDMGDMDNSFFLIGLMNEFMNRFQTVGDSFFREISWKQCFVLICIRLCNTPPTLKELSEIMGSSHQNIKQMLNKLEQAGFVTFISDTSDKRKQHIITTDKAEQFAQEHDEASDVFMKQLFQNVDAADLKVTVETLLKLDEQLKKMKV